MATNALEYVPSRPVCAETAGACTGVWSELMAEPATMDLLTFLLRRSDALSGLDKGATESVVQSLEILVLDCEGAGQIDWAAVAKSDLATIYSQGQEKSEAKTLIEEAYRTVYAARPGNPLLIMLVLHNRGAVSERLGDTAESLDWFWEAAEYARTQEMLRLRFKTETPLDFIFFEVGAASLETIANHYRTSEKNLDHARNLFHDTIRWLDIALNSCKGLKLPTAALLRRKATLLTVLGDLEREAGNLLEARVNLIRAANLLVRVGDLQDTYRVLLIARICECHFSPAREIIAEKLTD